MKKITLLFFSLVALNFISAQTIERGSEKDALAYMKAYSDWNVKKMKEFYADSIHFHDPTAVEAFKLNYNVKGKEKVGELFKSIFPDNPPEYLSFNISNHFVSGSFVVINSTFNLILPNSWYGDGASGKIFVSIPLVTVLRFSNGKIISHKDFVDYDSYKKQISLQLKTKK